MVFPLLHCNSINTYVKTNLNSYISTNDISRPSFLVDILFKVYMVLVLGEAWKITVGFQKIKRHNRGQKEL